MNRYHGDDNWANKTELLQVFLRLSNEAMDFIAVEEAWNNLLLDKQFEVVDGNIYSIY